MISKSNTAVRLLMEIHKEQVGESSRGVPGAAAKHAGRY